MAAGEGDPDPGPGLSRLAEQRPVGPALCGGQSRGNVQQLPGELLLSGFLQLPGINPHHHWDLRPGTLPQGTEPRPPCAWHTAGASQEAPHPGPCFPTAAARPRPACTGPPGGGARVWGSQATRLTPLSGVISETGRGDGGRSQAGAGGEAPGTGASLGNFSVGPTRMPQKNAFKEPKFTLTDYFRVLEEPPPQRPQAESSRVGGGVGPHPVGTLAKFLAGALHHSEAGVALGGPAPPGFPTASLDFLGLVLPSGHPAEGARTGRAGRAGPEAGRQHRSLQVSE